MLSLSYRYVFDTLIKCCIRKSFYNNYMYEMLRISLMITSITGKILEQMFNLHFQLISIFNTNISVRRSVSFVPRISVIFHKSPGNCKNIFILSADIYKMH